MQQQLVALGRANRIRAARAGLKQRIDAGETTAAVVLRQQPDEAVTMTVYGLLMAQRRWGPYRARKVLAVAQITETKTIGTLTERQQKVLVDLLTWGVA
jgi:hypothetical protein